MEEAEKMMALKKAYADIILNTAKEAAARVMASERKALSFENDLHYTKDEAHRLLLRFKHMFDAKTTEAEVTSLTQRRRIEELEAQLNEAEEMILDLRAQLRQAYDQLDKEKNNLVNGPNEKDNVPLCEITTNKKHITTSPFSLSPPQSNKCCDSTKQSLTEIGQFENFFVDDPALSSVILKSKEPELYRNGCTQRIRAIERNLGEEKLPYVDVSDQHMLIKSDPFINAHEHNVETCTFKSTNAHMDVMKIPSGSVKVCINSTAVKVQPVKDHKLPRKKSLYGKAKSTSRRFRQNQPHNTQQPSLDISHHKKNSDVGNNNDNSGNTLPLNKPEKINLVKNFSELEGKLPHDNGEAVFMPRRSLRKRKVRYQDDDIDPSTVPSVLSNCKMNSVNHNVTSVLDCLETDSEAGIKEEADFALASRNVSVDTKLDRDSRLMLNAEGKDANLLDESKLAKQDSNAAESIQMDNVISAFSNSFDAETSEATNGAPSHVDKSRVLTYTFSRKCKKEPLTNVVESSSLGGDRRAGEKVKISPEVQKSSLVDGSSRESRRLVQVARQLISLSGKRW